MGRSIRRWLTVALTAATAAIGSAVALPQAASAAVFNATPGTVYYWNDVLIEAFRRQGGAPTPLARAAAMTLIGLHDTINSAWWSNNNYTGVGHHNYTLDWTVGTEVDANLAAGFAARDLLIEALPAQSAFVQQKFTERHGSATQAEARQLADFIVNNMKQRRANDGSGNTTPYTLDNVPGAWRPTGSGGCTTAANAATPFWGNVKPFGITSGSQFRRPLPGGFTTYAGLLSSSLYANQFNEVKSLGRSVGSTRTADQTRAAWFWANDLDGTYKPPGQLLAHTKIVLQPRVFDTRDVALIFARVAMALADASIAAWDQKYLTAIDLWRPETAIAQAAGDNNPATAPDTAWRPLSADRNNVNFSPCFPAWVSGHATFAAAWAGVMRTRFGDTLSWTATTEDPHSAVGETRSFTGFTAAATENARSRIYLGVHYQFDADDGLATGYNVANFTYTNYFKPLNCTPNPCW